MAKKFIRPDLRTEEYEDDDTPGLFLFFRRIGSYFRDRSIWRGLAVLLALLLLIAALVAAIIGMVRFFRNVPEAPTHGTTVPPITAPPITQPPITTDPSIPTTPPPTQPPVTYPPSSELDISINGGSAVVPAVIPDFMPGDKATTIYAVEVTHKNPARLAIYSEILDGSSEMLADAIIVRITLPNEGITLWEGKLSEMYYEMTFDDGTEATHLILAITAEMPTDLDNEYQGLNVEAKYFWRLEPIS